MSFAPILPAPESIIYFANTWARWIICLALTFIAIGVAYVFFALPPDYQQGNSVKIMFVHVPTAWGSLAIYVLMCVFSILSLVYKSPLAGYVVKACIPVGLSICLICLITGAVWGKPMWGVWWVWDARLTSMLILFFIYVALYFLWNAFLQSSDGHKIGAICTLTGGINIPIVKFAVEWWNTLHQPASVLRANGPALSPEFLYPLLGLALSGAMLGAMLIVLCLRNEILARRLHAIQSRKLRRTDGE